MAREKSPQKSKKKRTSTDNSPVAKSENISRWIPLGVLGLAVFIGVVLTIRPSTQTGDVHHSHLDETYFKADAEEKNRFNQTNIFTVTTQNFGRFIKEHKDVLLVFYDVKSQDYIDSSPLLRQVSKSLRENDRKEGRGFPVIGVCDASRHSFLAYTEAPAIDDWGGFIEDKVVESAHPFNISYNIPLIIMYYHNGLAVQMYRDTLKFDPLMRWVRRVTLDTIISMTTKAHVEDLMSRRDDTVIINCLPEMNYMQLDEFSKGLKVKRNSSLWWGPAGFNFTAHENKGQQLYAACSPELCKSYFGQEGLIWMPNGHKEIKLRSVSTLSAEMIASPGFVGLSHWIERKAALLPQLEEQTFPTYLSTRAKPLVVFLVDTTQQMQMDEATTLGNGINTGRYDHSVQTVFADGSKMATVFRVKIEDLPTVLAVHPGTMNWKSISPSQLDLDRNKVVDELSPNNVPTKWDEWNMLERIEWWISVSFSSLDSRFWSGWARHSLLQDNATLFQDMMREQEKDNKLHKDHPQDIYLDYQKEADDMNLDRQIATLFITRLQKEFEEKYRKKDAELNQEGSENLIFEKVTNTPIDQKSLADYIPLYFDYINQMVYLRESYETSWKDQIPFDWSPLDEVGAMSEYHQPVISNLAHLSKITKDPEERKKFQQRAEKNRWLELQAREDRETPSELSKKEMRDLKIKFRDGYKTLHILRKNLYETLEKGVRDGKVKKGEKIEMDRVHWKDLSNKEFYDRYSSKGLPVVITGLDITGDEPWTLDFIKSKCGSKSADLKVKDRSQRTWGKLVKVARTNISEFIDTFRVNETRKKWYLHDWSLPKRCPEIFGEAPFNGFTMPQYFVNDYFQRRPFAGHAQTWPSLFVGANQTESSVHIDSAGTNFWLYLFSGQKLWHVYDRKAEISLYPEATGGNLDIDVFNVNLTQFPLFEYATEYWARQMPGDLVFIPGGAPHAVRNEADIHGVSMNYVDGSNYLLHLLSEVLIDHNYFVFEEMMEKDFPMGMRSDQTHLRWGAHKSQPYRDIKYDFAKDPNAFGQR